MFLGRACRTEMSPTSTLRGLGLGETPLRRWEAVTEMGRSQALIRTIVTPSQRQKQSIAVQRLVLHPTIRRLAKGTIDLVRWRAPVQLLKYATRTVWFKNVNTGYPVVVLTPRFPDPDCPGTPCPAHNYWRSEGGARCSRSGENPTETCTYLVTGPGSRHGLGAQHGAQPGT